MKHLRITKAQVTLGGTGKSLIAEASELGLRPGEWPERVTVVFGPGREYVFGPGRVAVGMGIELGGV